MKLARTSAYQSLVALFLLAMVLGPYGCSDSATVNPEVELASLTVSTTSGPVALQPAFSSTTTQYSVDLPSNITSVTITAQERVAGDTVSIDGQTTRSRSITLGPAEGPPTVVSIVVSESSSKSRTYTVVLNRASLAGNNDLSALTVTLGTLSPAFAAGTLSYIVDVDPDVTSVTVSATKADPNAAMTGSVTAGAGIPAGQAAVQLGGQGTATPVIINVTAPNGSSKTYAITVNRALSDNNNLSALTVTLGTLSPVFAAGTLSYTADVAPNVTSVTVSATKADPNAAMTGSVTAGAGIPAGQAAVQLGGQGTATPVIINVTAPNGSSKAYTITVNRRAPPSDTLSALAVSAGPLSPNFSPSTLNYVVNTSANDQIVTVSATKADPNAVMSIAGVMVGAGTTTGQTSITLGGPGTATPVTITVVAPGVSSKNYIITIIRPSR